MAVFSLFPHITEIMKNREKKQALVSLHKVTNLIHKDFTDLITFQRPYTVTLEVRISTSEFVGGEEGREVQTIQMVSFEIKVLILT
jgi:hypothetical protein